MSNREPDNSPARGCPDEMHLAAYVDGGLKPGDRPQLENHLATCDYCLGQVSALMKMQDVDLPDADLGLVRRAHEIPQAKTRSQWILDWRWAAACTLTVCAVIVFGLWVKPPQPAEKGNVRASYTQAGAPELILPREGAALKPGAIEFRWTAMNRALFYEVRVLNADGDMMWQARVDGPEAHPPADVTFPTGQNYFVSVSAWLPENKTAKSAVVGFRLTDR